MNADMRDHFPDNLRYLYDAIEETRPIWKGIRELSPSQIVERSREVAGRLANLFATSRDSGDLMELRKVQGRFEGSADEDERKYCKSIRGFMILLTTLAKERVPEFIPYEIDHYAYIDARMAEGNWERVPSELRYLESPAERFWRIEDRKEESVMEYLTDEDVEELRAIAEKFRSNDHERMLEEYRKSFKSFDPVYEKIDCLLSIIDQLDLP